MRPYKSIYQVHSTSKFWVIILILSIWLRIKAAVQLPNLKVYNANRVQLVLVCFSQSRILFQLSFFKAKHPLLSLLASYHRTQCGVFIRSCARHIVKTRRVSQNGDCQRPCKAASQPWASGQQTVEATLTRGYISYNGTRLRKHKRYACTYYKLYWNVKRQLYKVQI